MNLDLGKEFVGATARVLVLSILSQGPSYGYEILKRLEAETHGALVWQEGTLYPVLHALEKGKWVQGKWQKSENDRRRRYYYITAAGREALRRAVMQWNLMDKVIQRLGGMEHAYKPA